MEDDPQKIELANTVPGIGWEELSEARDAIFRDRMGVPYEELLQRTEEAYKPIDLEKYAARAQNFSDSVQLASLMSDQREDIIRRVLPGERSNNMLVLGCGQGRLMEIYVAAAQKLGIEHITFNDLIVSHVEQTREKAKRLYGKRLTDAGVKMDFVAGDFLIADFRRRYDHVDSLWYVGAEMLNPESAQALRRHRREVYRKVHDVLVPQGNLLEDLPDPNLTGYYELGKYITQRVLRRAPSAGQGGLLFGEQENLLLTNWKYEQKTGFPFQLRYVPTQEADQREKMEAGFAYVTTRQLTVPVGSEFGSDTIHAAIREADSIEEVIARFDSRSSITLPTDDVKKRRKMTIWRREH